MITLNDRDKRLAQAARRTPSILFMAIMVWALIIGPIVLLHWLGTF